MDGNDAALHRIHGIDLSCLQRFQRLGVDRSAHRLHEKESQHQGQANQGLIARRALQPKRLPEKMKDNQQAREWRHAHQQGWNQREERQQGNNGP